jgi:circularly permuted ATPgrasp domain protein
MHVRAHTWELQQSLNDHLLTANGAAERVRELLELAYRERAAQAGPQTTMSILPAPLLLDAADHARLAPDMARFTDLLLDLPARLYGHDLERMCHDLGLGALETATICAVGADTPVVFARCDLYETDRGWRLVEVGVGGGMGLGNVGDLNRLQLADPCIGPFLGRHDMGFRDPLDAFAADLRRACRAAGLPAVPMVGVVDWTRYYDQCITFLERYVAALERHGFRAETCHVRQLVRRDGRLHLGDRMVDALVMNYLLEDLHQDPGDIETILACQVDGTVLSAMTNYGDLVGSKGSLALLWRALEGGRLSPAEAELVRDYVPETRIVEPGPLRMLGRAGDVASVLTALRSKLVLKPVVGSSGAGVFLGPACDEAAWRAAVRSALDAPRTHVAQQLLEPAPVALPALDAEGALELRQRTVMLSVYIVAGAGLAGYVVRCGRPDPTSILSTTTGAEVGAVFHAGA